jgi:hypothetical protein
MDRGWQNLDSMGLAGKILENKDLEAATEIPDWLGAVRTIPILRFPDSRSRLFVTGFGYFSVEGCGKSEDGFGSTLRGRRAHPRIRVVPPYGSRSLFHASRIYESG